jgi:hypothetical protein
MCFVPLHPAQLMKPAVPRSSTGAGHMLTTCSCESTCGVQLAHNTATHVLQPSRRWKEGLPSCGCWHNIRVKHVDCVSLLKCTQKSSGVWHAISRRPVADLSVPTQHFPNCISELTRQLLIPSHAFVRRADNQGLRSSDHNRNAPQHRTTPGLGSSAEHKTGQQVTPLPTRVLWLPLTAQTGAREYLY